LQALDAVDLRLRKGTIHALLGENGAGKSTLVKCVMGFYQTDTGSVTLYGKEVQILNPQAAAAQHIGMVYQHFTLVENMTALENIVLARPKLPAIIDWQKEARLIGEKMQHMPFQIDLQRRVTDLSAGEKQKLEIVKQLMLDTRILILDEPTSVLTPIEADEVLEKIAALCKERGLTVLMITHKFREVMNYADDVTVLRKGKLVGSVQVINTNPDQLSEMMMGVKIESSANIKTPNTDLAQPHQTRPNETQPHETQSDRTKESHQTQTSGKLMLADIYVKNDHGVDVVDGLSLQVNAGEILGIAGVSGNGQSELVAALSGQRSMTSGKITVDGQAFSPTRQSIAQHRLYCLPEEPLRNACIGDLSVAQNMALRNYDSREFSWFGWILNFNKIQRYSQELIKQFNVKTPGPAEPIKNLSGGNVQRAVLARELSQDVNVLVIANPCFGLDFKAVQDIHRLIVETRNNGAAVLLLSEDLDEVMELSDRFFVMSKGKLSHEGRPESADIVQIGHAMAGHNQFTHTDSHATVTGGHSA
ncbi:MAG: ABC transporter ATP-binding protein, partial [Oleibacter sp.]|nr:ABC transporter ATP-binding protein [Thalassolituus sp.]